MKERHEITMLAEAKESLVMALHAVAAHKLRSALTLLGVLIGVFVFVGFIAYSIVSAVFSVSQSFKM